MYDLNSHNHTLYQSIGDEFQLGELISVENIQALWGGYGELVRLCFPKQNIIVKHVKLPKPDKHPRGWNSNLSHQRKLHSYRVEVNWYKHFSTPSDASIPIAQGLKSFQTENEWLIVMEDLKQKGFTTTTMHPNRAQLKSALTWLAHFHARYMGVESMLLWETGTYWHLETRPDEYKVLRESPLKTYAETIDRLLKETPYQTIVHGDAKVANFLFTEDGSQATAVDFQYVGHGCGMKDIAYFMSSAIAPEACEAMQGWVLDSYFQALSEALKEYQPQLESQAVEKTWRPLFAVAWADFQRFIKGWSPEHFKINTYSEALTEKAITYIQSLE
jgi:thiamine kinase-like enzyme